MSRFADVILPLPLNSTFTYRIPQTMKLAEGERVLVSFGAKKYYTALVDRLHDEEPKGFEVKEIIEQLDREPLLLPQQNRLWHWMADYYLCSLGDVFKAALPSGLKLESETVISCIADILPDDLCQEKVRLVWSALSVGHDIKLAQLQKKLPNVPLLPIIRILLERGLVSVQEEVYQKYRPRIESFVTLGEEYQSEEALHAAFDILKKAECQRRLLLSFLELSGWADRCNPTHDSSCYAVSRTQLLRHSGSSAALLQALVKRGILAVRQQEVGRLSQHSQEVSCASSLSEAQTKALESIRQTFAEKNVCLLHGVTSSGKTEVYIHLIQEYLERGQQVLFMLPEIVLTTQLTERLRRVFGKRLGVYHSRLSDAERVEIWKKQLSDNPYEVLVGVRSSVFLPFRNLGLVIVDEEHEPSYKQQDPAPRYHARNVALVLASFYGAATLLGTATPSFETYYHARSGKYGLVNLHTRYANVALPEVHIVDIKDLKKRKLMNGPFSPVLLQSIHEALERGEQVILFQNRRGFAPVVQCKDCGWTPKCKNCDVSLTYHKRQNMLACHYCGFTSAIPVSCPSCGNHILRQIGFGTEKLEDEIQAFFPQARIARMDLDTTRSRQAYEHILQDFEIGRTDILIGTQMVSKGLDFDRVRVVGILDADGMLNIPDFRSYERAYQMMAQVAGRAGRRNNRGIVYLQTRTPDSPVVTQVVTHDYLNHYMSQMHERQLFLYPPFCHLIYIYMKYRYEKPVEELAKLLVVRLREVFGNRILGPDAPPVGRVQSLYIRKIVLKVERTASLSKVRSVLLEQCQFVQGNSDYGSVQLYFDVDPM